jgi:hypothetical protein
MISRRSSPFYEFLDATKKRKAEIFFEKKPKPTENSANSSMRKVLFNKKI